MEGLSDYQSCFKDYLANLSEQVGPDAELEQQTVFNQFTVQIPIRVKQINKSIKTMFAEEVSSLQSEIDKSDRGIKDNQKSNKSKLQNLEKAEKDLLEQIEEAQ